MKTKTLISLINLFEKQASFLLQSVKKDKNAKIRNRGDVVFPAESKNVKDDKDHFPINSQNQARNALQRVNQYSSSPEWYSGSLKSLINSVVKSVLKKYPNIKITSKSKNPKK